MDTLQGMRTFTAVVTTGSFTAAADQLNTSTKLTSKYVRQLEERLGVQLLQRTTRSLSLTDAGRVFYERCIQIIEDYDELVNAVQEKQVNPRGKLIVSAPRNFGEKYFSPVVGEFVKQYPEISVDLRLTDRFVRLVDEGFDMALRIGHLEDSALIAKRLSHTNIVVCASREYIEREGEPEHPEDLKDHNCIIDTNWPYGRHWPFDIDGASKSILVNGDLQVNGARAARIMALSGAGVALCPIFAIAQWVPSGDLKILLEDYQDIELGIYAVYPTNRHLSAKLRVFIDFIAKNFKQHNPWMLEHYLGEGICHIPDVKD